MFGMFEKAEFEKVDVDWESFEQKFNISRDDVEEVKNIYRMVAKVYVLKHNLEMFYENSFDKNEIVKCYYFHMGNWGSNNINYCDISSMVSNRK